MVLHAILHTLSRDLEAWCPTDQREVAGIDILRDILILVVAVPPLAAHVIRPQLVEDISIHSEAEVVLPAVIEVRRVRGEESTVALVLCLSIAVAPHPLIGIVVVEAIEELFTHLELRVSVRYGLLSIGLRCSPVGLTESHTRSDTTDRRVAQVVARIILVQILERLHSHLQVRLDEPIGFSDRTTASRLIELSIGRIFITHDDPWITGCRRGIVALSEELDELVVSIGTEGIGFPYGVADLLILTLLFGQGILEASDSDIRVLDEGVVEVPSQVVDDSIPTLIVRTQIGVLSEISSLRIDDIITHQVKAQVERRCSSPEGLTEAIGVHHVMQPIDDTLEPFLGPFSLLIPQ